MRRTMQHYKLTRPASPEDVCRAFFGSEVSRCWMLRWSHWCPLVSGAKRLAERKSSHLNDCISTPYCPKELKSYTFKAFFNKLSPLFGLGCC